MTVGAGVGGTPGTIACPAQPTPMVGTPFTSVRLLGTSQFPTVLGPGKVRISVAIARGIEERDNSGACVCLHLHWDTQTRTRTYAHTNTDRQTYILAHRHTQSLA